MKLFVAHRDDAHQGWVWLQIRGFPVRCVVRITNPSNGRSICCEALQIDQNFLDEYNQSPRFAITDPNSSLVLGQWYRTGLGGLAAQSEVALTIKAANGWWGRFRACTDHPQIVVRLAAWLGGIGLLLGVIGLD
jgi:hypothetical protein